jgi:hypothetical protein
MYSSPLPLRRGISAGGRGESGVGAIASLPGLVSACILGLTEP